jgi:hypothetical protein
MQWIDRQGSSNIKDQRSAMTAGSVSELMVQLEALDNTLTVLENQAAGVPPLPRRRPMGKAGTWMDDQRDAATQYMIQVLDVPRPRPDPRRYTNGQK